jgi:ADP-ribose pyrophosphatase
MSDTKRGPERPTVEIVDRTTVYDGFFRLDRYHLRHRLYRGDMSPVLTRELFERGHAVAVLPYDPIRDEVVLLEQFRIGAIHEANPWLREVVAGIIEPGESREEVARREMAEEAGCQLLDLVPIHTYYVSPGGTSETVSLFCGRVDASGVGGLHGLADEVEDIRVRPVPFDEAMDLVRRGEINSAAPIMAMQWLAMNRDWLRGQWR